MTLTFLQNDMQNALKMGDKTKRMVLGDIIASIQKMATAGKTKVEITDTMVDEALIKYQKMVQEMIDTCPADRAETLADYNQRMKIVKEYAPQMITDPEEIKSIVLAAAGDMELSPANRGAFMKTVMPTLKGKVDMKIANQVITNLLNGG